MSDGDSDWLKTWADQHLAFTVTLVEGSSAADLVERVSGASPDGLEVLTLEQMDGLDGLDWVRVGDEAGWGFMVEHFTAHGTDEAFLHGVAPAARSVTVSHTQTLSVFLYAEEGKVLAGFELEMPDLRYGSTPAMLDDVIAEVWDGDAPGWGVDVNRLVEALTGGVSITEEMLAGPLLCAPVRSVRA